MRLDGCEMPAGRCGRECVLFHHHRYAGHRVPKELSPPSQRLAPAADVFESTPRDTHGSSDDRNQLRLVSMTTALWVRSILALTICQRQSDGWMIRNAGMSKENRIDAGCYRRRQQCGSQLQAQPLQRVPHVGDSCRRAFGSSPAYGSPGLPGRTKCLFARDVEPQIPKAGLPDVLALPASDNRDNVGTSGKPHHVNVAERQSMASLHSEVRQKIPIAKVVQHEISRRFSLDVRHFQIAPLE